MSNAAKSPVEVTWKIEKTGTTLEISYEIENRSGELIHVLDQTIIPQERGIELAPMRAIVRNDAPGVVSIVKGHIRPRAGQAVGSEYTPGSRPLENGKKVAGMASIPLPLVAWHPYMTMQPLAKDPTQAVLEIGYLTSDPPKGRKEWDEEPLVTGGKMKIPSLAYVLERQKIVKTMPLPLP